MALTKIDDRGLKTPIDLLDGEKIQLGTGNDLQLWHTGSDSIIKDNGTGSLKILGSNVTLQNAAGTQNGLIFTEGGAVSLYDNNKLSLKTQSNHIELTGSVSESNILFKTSDGTYRALIGTTNDGSMNLYTNGSSGQMNALRLRPADGVELLHQGVKKFETISTGVTITGLCNVAGGSTESPVTVSTSNDYVGKFESTDAAARLIVEDSASTANHNGLQVAGDTCMLVAGNAFSVKGIGGGATEINHNGVKKFETFSGGCKIQGDLHLNNDGEYIWFGDSDDLKIGHTGSISDIVQTTDTEFQIRHSANNGIQIRTENAYPVLIRTGGEESARFEANGAVKLYYDNVKKFETRSDGTQTTGIAYADAFHVNDSEHITLGDGNDLDLYHDGSNSYIHNNAGNLIIEDNNGQIFLQSTVVSIESEDGETQATFTADGSVDLYHNNVKTFNTCSTGMELRAGEGGNCELYMYADEGDDNADLWKFVAFNDPAGNFNLYNKYSGSWEQSIGCAGDAGVSLYYNNTLNFSTVDGGVSLPDGKVLKLGASDDIQIYHSEGSSTNYYYHKEANQNTRHQFHSGGTWRVETTAAESRILCDNDTAVHMYFNGSRKWATHSNGTFAYTMLPFNDDADDLGASSYRWDDVYATNGSIQTSDRNEKNTIVESDLGLSFVNKLKPVSYKFNTGTRTHYGLIAQDIETTLSDISKTTTEFAGFIKEDTPEIKYVEKDDLPEGKSAGDVKYAAGTKYGLRYTEFIGPLVKAVQELSTEVETLKTKVAALEAA